MVLPAAWEETRDRLQQSGYEDVQLAKLGHFFSEDVPVAVARRGEQPGATMDEASRCDRVSLMQDGKLLVTDRPGEIGRRYPRPLFAIKCRNVLGLLGALRSFPHVASVWPLGETLHYTDRRNDVPAATIETELAAYVEQVGLSGVVIEPIPATIEDAFMWYMTEKAAA